MRRRRHAPIAVGLLLAGSVGATPPEPPPGGAVDGDVVAGTEAAGVDATEWDTLSRGGLQALLEAPRVDLVAFYKNLNASSVADEDDAYHVYARRCGDRGTLTEACDAEDIVFDHVVFTRTATPDGRFDFDVIDLATENPVGSPLAIAPVNPFGSPSAPGPVHTADRDDPRRDPRRLATFGAEVGAATRSNVESGGSEDGVTRHFVPAENTSYPYPYERLAAVFDDADAPDLYYSPIPSGDGPRGGHGALDVTQSRTTLVVSGRSARRTPLDPAAEAALEIHNVDVAPTVARVLGIPPHTAAQFLNNGDAAANPDAPDGLLRRQDGKPVDALLEPRLNAIVLVIDGMLPENVTATSTPNLCSLVGASPSCTGATVDPDAHSTTYTQARGVMVSQTNANHTAMMTGARGGRSGIFANSFFNRTSGEEEPLDRPSLIRVDTLFDALRRDRPHLRTAAVMGKSKLRELFDCTHDGSGNCIADSTDNPEGVPVTHVRPDYLRGAAEVPDNALGDCPAEPASGSGVAQDACVMDLAIELLATEDPDFSFINLGNVDAIQHVNGPNSPGGDAAVLEADRQVGRLVAYLKESGKWERSVLIVTADHSFSWTGPLPFQRTDLAAALTTACPTVGFDYVSNSGTGHVYLQDIAVPPSFANESDLLCLRTAALAQPGVHEALYRVPNDLDPGNNLNAVHPTWGLKDFRAGDLIVTALASGPAAGPNDPTAAGGNPYEVASGAGFLLGSPVGADGVLQGHHGHPGARHVPFYVISGGDFVVDQVLSTHFVTEGDDTAFHTQAEAIDVAPTIGWALGLDPETALPSAQGRVLEEAFTERPIDAVEPHANRAIVFIFDGNNSVRIHELMADCDAASCGDPANVPVAAVRSLLLTDTDARSDAPQGTLTSFGSISAFPSVTFPNHNVVGSGVLPGHHGVVGNRYYERDVELERDPIDPTDPRNPIFFFSSALLRTDFETLHEAVHRGFGDWSPANPDGAYTASVDEPSARGADFASLETASSEDAPALFALLAANVVEFEEDTHEACGQEDPEGYGQESVLDHLGQSQVRALYSDPSTGDLSRPVGVPDPLLVDESGGVGHPDPKYLIANFTLTDGAGHTFGPHGNCARQAYGETSRRLTRILDELRNHGRFDTEGEPARLGETFIVLTGDHGMENQDQANNGGFDTGLTAADVEYVRQGNFLYLLTLDVEIDGIPPGGLEDDVSATLTFTVTDADARSDGSRTPVSGARVDVTTSDGTTTGFTDANGRTLLTFTPRGTSVEVRVDHDTNPAQGGRTLGSDTPSVDEGQAEVHGRVVKADFNDRRIALPVSP